jgi:ectoine hydroxylase-related dioxygenase (phytanoyl-CoA dioxygenase family)
MTAGLNILTHGVRERAISRSQIDLHVEELARRGVTVIPDLYGEEELRRARDLLTSLYDRQVEEIGGPEQLKKINDANIIRSPLVFDDFFVRMAADPRVLSIVRAVIGDKVSLSSQVGVISRPSVHNYQQAWHRELQYQHFTSSRPLAVQTLVCIDPFTAETGATFFLEGSHLFEEFPSDDYVRKYEWQSSAKAGSALLFNSMVYHRGATNRSGANRIGVNNLYTLPIIAQQIDLARMLDGRYSDQQELRELLGYEWNPAPDVKTWRGDRLARADRAASSPKDPRREG